MPSNDDFIKNLQKFLKDNPNVNLEDFARNNPSSMADLMRELQNGVPKIPTIGAPPRISPKRRSRYRDKIGTDMRAARANENYMIQRFFDADLSLGNDQEFLNLFHDAWYNLGVPTKQKVALRKDLKALLEERGLDFDLIFDYDEFDPGSV